MPGALMEPYDQTTKRLKASDPSVNSHFADMAPYSPPKANNETLSNGIQLTNGNYELPNGVNPNGIPRQPVQISPHVSKDVENMLSGQLPPEIEHITVGFLSLSTLTRRLTQETFNEMTEVISDMSEQSASQSINHGSASRQGLANGIPPKDDPQENVRKKLRMLNFAQNRRSQFIKILVLSQWSRQAEQVRKCIDLKRWFDIQRMLYVDAVAWIAHLQRLVEPTKLMNLIYKLLWKLCRSGKRHGCPIFTTFLLVK